MADPCVLLTATIDVKKSIAFLKRSDSKLRLDDYKRALRLWLADPSVSRLVICENSGADLEELRAIVEDSRQYDKTIEILSFVQSSFPGHLGKGYGEMKTLSHMLDNSKVLADSAKFIKVSGRYYVRNIKPLVDYLSNHEDIDIVCDLSENLSFADSRCFGGSVSFMRQYLCPMQEYINDSDEVYFEHVLARAVHRAISDGKRWSLLPCAPDIVGVSGTSNIPYKASAIRRVIKELRYKVKRFMFLR